ncbi:MAG: transcriptional regulator, partial [Coriobacteriaceae bacterium]|nr:transcriptional regulator [Coriobacteriaceae bacterium]
KPAAPGEKPALAAGATATAAPGAKPAARRQAKPRPHKKGRGKK